MKMKNRVSIILAAVCLSLTSCLSEDLLNADYRKQEKDGKIDAGLSIDSVMPVGANQLTVNVTAIQSDAETKTVLGTKVDTASVEVVSYHRGDNPEIPESVIGGLGDEPATKAIYNSNSTRLLDSNFLRLDEVIGENGEATYEWPNWGKAKLLEAEVISTPENASGLYYRSVTFTPTQAYNIRTYNDDRDTLFYHSRMISWHPMILSVPRDGDKAAAVEFSNSRYANNRYNVTADEFGVVFDHSLDGSVDLMMSNMVEGQRWHKKFNPNLPESSDWETYNRKHYADKNQTQEEYVYTMPFGHYTHPEYANPVINRHYLSAVRLWAVVENNGESTSLNLKTWGEIVNVSFVDQPSTAIISLPKEVSTPFYMNEDGTLEKNPDGTYRTNRQKLIWGNVVSWGDETNFDIHPDRMFGEDTNNADKDYTVQYPVDMTKDGGVRLTKTYLGYCLVKPFADYELSKTNGIKLAIQTSAGIYYATIPSIATYEEDGQTKEVNMFQESQIYDVILNLRTEGSINEFIEKENDVNYINLSPYDTQNQNFLSANSYIIDINDLRERIESFSTEGPAGYCFTGSIMGNGQRGVVTDGSVTFPTSDAVIRGATSARIVWQSSRDLITNVQLQHEYVRFIVNKAEEGNAVLAVTDASGKILWSWHIWITEDPTKNPLTVTVIPAQAGMEASTIKMLDRNLGAISNNPGSDDATLFSTFGLYYQWGRKDPLPGPIEKNTFTSLITPVYDGFSEEMNNLYANSFGSGIEASIQNPMNYLYCDDSPYYQYNWMQRPIDFIWGLNTGGKIQKTIYDPCPFGYRVPNEEIQNLFENAKSVSQTDGKGVTVTSPEDVQVFFPYAGFIGSERGQYSREPEFNYVSSKGDYSSGLICPPAMVSSYSYFSNHRLRTYLAKESWTEENIDGVGLYTFNVPSGEYRVRQSGIIPRDYTNRTTAASVRCVQDKSYEGKGYANLTLPQNYSSKDVIPGNVLRLTIKGGLNIGIINATLTIQPYSGNTPVGDPAVLYLVDRTYPEFHLEKKTTTLIEGTYDYTFPSDFIDKSITSFTFTLKVSDKENPKLDVDPAQQSIGMTFADLIFQDNSTIAPAAGKPLLTVENGRNFTKTNDPLVGQPAKFTLYVNKYLADQYKAIYGGDPVVSGSVKNADNKTFTPLAFSPTGSTSTISGKDYYEFCSDWYTNDCVGAAGDKKEAEFNLTFTGGITPPSEDMRRANIKITADDGKIKIWGIVTSAYGINDRFVRKGIMLVRQRYAEYYLRATDNASMSYSTTTNVFDYSSLFYWDRRVSWRASLTDNDPKGPANIKSVKYSIAGGENRWWYISSTSTKSGVTVTLNTSPSNFYVHDRQERTLYINNDGKSGNWLQVNESRLRVTTSGLTPASDGTNGYHIIYSVLKVKDPTAQNAQYLPFTGSGSDDDKADDGNFDSNYLIF